jgi:hypothetical protein
VDVTVFITALTPKFAFFRTPRTWFRLSAGTVVVFAKMMPKVRGSLSSVKNISDGRTIQANARRNGNEREGIGNLRHPDLLDSIFDRY